MGGRNIPLGDRLEEPERARGLERQPRGVVAGRERCDLEDGPLYAVRARRGDDAEPDSLGQNGRVGCDDLRPSLTDVLNSRGLGLELLGSLPAAHPDAEFNRIIPRGRSSVSHRGSLSDGRAGPKRPNPDSNSRPMLCSRRFPPIEKRRSGLRGRGRRRASKSTDDDFRRRPFYWIESSAVRWSRSILNRRSRFDVRNTC